MAFKVAGSGGWSSLDGVGHARGGRLPGHANTHTLFPPLTLFLSLSSHSRRLAVCFTLLFRLTCCASALSSPSSCCAAPPTLLQPPFDPFPSPLTMQIVVPLLVALALSSGVQADFLMLLNDGSSLPPFLALSRRLLTPTSDHLGSAGAGTSRPRALAGSDSQLCHVDQWRQ